MFVFLMFVLAWGVTGLIGAITCVFHDLKHFGFVDVTIGDIGWTLAFMLGGPLIWFVILKEVVDQDKVVFTIGDKYGKEED